MSAIAIAIEMSPKETFLNVYLTFTKIKRKIFHWILWFYTTKRNAFPSLSYLAKKAGCGVWYACQVVKEFAVMGWVTKQHRPNQSTCYTVHPEIVNLNLKDRALFDRKKPDFTSENPNPNPKLVKVVKYSYSKYSSPLAQKARLAWQAVQETQEKHEKKSEFEHLPIECQEYLKFLCPDELLNEVKTSVSNAIKQGSIISNLYGYFISCCFNKRKQYS